MAKTPTSPTFLLCAAAGAWLVFRRRSGPSTEDEQIRRRYGRQLAEAQPMPVPTDRPVVEVTAFRTLAKLARHHRRLILHWTADGSTTYLVLDDVAAYRYRVGAVAVPQPHDTPAGDRAEPARRPQPPPDAKDDLTDLAGRTVFEDEMQRALRAGGGERLCLMLIDVDNLDSLNEEHGRAVGDAVLVGTAERLRRAVRPWDLVARLAGDDFAVLFADVGPEVVDGVAERILGMARESMPVRGRLVPVRVSLGLARARPDQDAVLLMEQAKAALYRAKAANGAHYAWFDAS